MMSETRPKAGDKIRVQKSYWSGDIHFEEYKLDELDYCLGFYGEDGPKSPCNFTPLCWLVEPAPDSTDEYWSNYGGYHSAYVKTYEIIRS